MWLYTHTHTHTGILENKNKKSSVQKNGKRVEFQNIKYVEKLKNVEETKKIEREREKSWYSQKAGITLIALVITIIVLIILAGISITMISGQDGILTRAGNAKVQTSVAQAEEMANLIYLELLEGLDDPTIEGIKAGLEEKGYTVNEIATDGSAIKGIKLSKTSVSLGVGESDEIEVSYDSDGDKAYYVVIDGRSHKMTLNNGKVSIDKTETETGAGQTSPLTAKCDNENIEVKVSGNKIIVKDKGNKSATGNITVKYGELTKICSVAVVKTPGENDPVVASTTFSTNYGKIDVVWLSGTTNTVISTPNIPILRDGANSMTPVVYDETAQNFITATDTSNGNWYNYSGNEDTANSVTDGNKWANATTANGSYFVWIPRYAYKITYYDSETSKTPTGYYDGYGMWDATTGNKRCELDAGIETVNVGKEKYIVHPAFGSKVDNGGWSSNISGFWCAKYEASEGTGSTLQFVPNVSSWRDQKIGLQYSTAINATYGYTISNANTDGIKSFMYSHMMKNSEWGAVAYLTQSKYGRNGKEIDINDSRSFITGNGGGSTSASSASGTINAYNTVKGVKASTTGNVYGIYDMSGGAMEHVALFNSKDEEGYFSSYGWDAIGNIPEIKNTVNSETKLTSATSTKYATKYDNKTGGFGGNSIIYRVEKIGDATKEVNTGGSYSLNLGNKENSNWFSDFIRLTRSNSPFAMRGSYYGKDSIKGIFCTSANEGFGSQDISFRTVLVP